MDVLCSWWMQISEVVNSMKDLIDYSRETGTGPMGKFNVLNLSISSLRHTSNFLTL